MLKNITPKKFCTFVEFVEYHFCHLIIKLLKIVLYKFYILCRFSGIQLGKPRLSKKSFVLLLHRHHNNTLAANAIHFIRKKFHQQRLFYYSIENLACLSSGGLMIFFQNYPHSAAFNVILTLVPTLSLQNTLQDLIIETVLFTLFI